MSEAPTLLTVPNFSVAGDVALIDELIDAGAPLTLLARHSDPDHGRTVLTFAGRQGRVATALARMATVAAARIDIAGHPGVHPHIGAIDVAPVVHLSHADRGAACAEALTAAHEIAMNAAMPVFLYGDLAAGRERAQLRAGGLPGLAKRITDGSQRPDFGGPHPHQTAGATLVAARPPLVAFNFELHPDHTLDQARAVAAQLRESGGGPTGVRAIGLWLASRGIAQVSCNVHDPFAVPLAKLLEQISRHAQVTGAELVGLAPSVAFDGWPGDVPVSGLAAGDNLIENALRRHGL
jgi:glutamate formiminotransferase/glutamate formiminotransferase/formiminotetrahydrofolate cyclodeaminase